jgi:hypothetical protein
MLKKMICAALFAGAMAVPGEAQSFSVRLTSAPTWQKGSPYLVSWSYSGAPPAIVSQRGIRVVAVSMAGVGTSYNFSQQPVAVSAGQTTIPALNFTYMQDTPIQIVLQDDNGNKLTAPFTVTIKMPAATNFTMQITSADPLVTNGQTGYVRWTYSGAPPASLVSCGVDVIFTTPERPFQLTRRNPVTAQQAPLGGIGFAPNTSGTITLADSCSGQNLTPAGRPVVVQASGGAPTPPPTAAPPAAATGNPAWATAACNYVFGQGCTGNFSAFATYLIQPSGATPMFSSQAAMQTYLMNAIGTNPGMKADVIARASGGQPCTEALTALTNAFTANPNNPQGNGLWNSYAQLASMASGVVRSKCTVSAPPAVQWTQQQHDQALSAAVSKLMGATTPTGQTVNLSSQQAALFANVAPANIEGQMRASIGRDQNWQALIVDYMFYAAFRKTETAAVRSQLLGLYGKYWTAGDDLYKYLAANSATFNPSVAPAQLTAALNAAFTKLVLQAPTAAQAAAFSGVTDPNAMEGSVRGYIQRDANLQSQILVSAYPLVYGRGTAPPTASRNQILAGYGRNWTAADDLQTFLTANKGTYAPQSPAAPPAPPSATKPAQPQITARVDRLLVNVNGVSVLLPTQLGGKCMTVEGNAFKSTTYDGARIIGYQCENAPQARFVFMNNGQLRDHDGGNMCLDLNGAQVVTKPCSDSSMTQKWNLLGSGEIRSVQTGQCMSLVGGQQNWVVDAIQHAINWQQPVQAVGCNGSNEQKWALSVKLPGTANQRPQNQTVVQNGQLAPISNVLANFSAVVAAGGGNVVAAGGGNVVAAGGGNLKLVAIGGALLTSDGAGVVAAGGGNLVNTNGSNLVGTGGSSVVGSNGSGVVAAGGGNIVAAGGGNIAVLVSLPQLMSGVVAAGGGNAVKLDLGAGVISLPYQGGSVISDGSASLLQPVSSVVAMPTIP